MTRQKALLTTIWLLGFSVVSGSALLALSAPDAAPTFETRCTRCHSLDQVTAKLVARPAETREQFLTQFLGRHFPPPEEERAMLAAYLAASTPR